MNMAELPAGGVRQNPLDAILEASKEVRREVADLKEEVSAIKETKALEASSREADSSLRGSSVYTGRSHSFGVRPYEDPFAGENPVTLGSTDDKSPSG